MLDLVDVVDGLVELDGRAPTLTDVLEANLVALGEEGVKAHDELGMPMEKYLDALDDAHRINPAKGETLTPVSDTETGASTQITRRRRRAGPRLALTDFHACRREKTTFRPTMPSEPVSPNSSHEVMHHRPSHLDDLKSFIISKKVS